MGVSFLIVVFTGIFIAPMVLGAFIVAHEADERTVNAWFGFSILVFIAMAALGGLFILANKPG